jgi:hypothetical protein
LGDDLLKNKGISSLLLMSILILISIIMLTNMKVQGTQSSYENVGLDYDFIYDNVITDLSEIIFDPVYGVDNNIWKGRCFGTLGENEAADKLVNWITNNTDNLISLAIKKERIGNESIWLTHRDIMRRCNNKIEIINYHVDLEEGISGNPDVIIPNNESFPFPNITNKPIWENHTVKSGSPIKIHWPPIDDTSFDTNNEINFSRFGLNISKYNISFSYLNTSIIGGEVVYYENITNLSLSEKSLKIHLINVSDDEYINTVESLYNNYSLGFIIIRDDITNIKDSYVNLSGVAVSSQNGSLLKNLTENGTVVVIPYDENLSSETGLLRVYHCTTNLSDIEKEIYIINASWLENRFLEFLEIDKNLHSAAGFLLCSTEFNKTHFQYPYANLIKGPLESYSRLIHPMISINGTVILNGQKKDVWEWIYEMYQTDYPVSLNFSITQRKNPEVISYNVFCDIQGKDTDEWFVMSGGHYDGWYGQMTCDNAVGTAQMLGILKYLNDNEITPKCNIRFIFHGGEENVALGSFSHVFNLSNRYVLRNAKYIINLCQLGLHPIIQ